MNEAMINNLTPDEFLQYCAGRAKTAMEALLDDREDAVKDAKTTGTTLLEALDSIITDVDKLHEDSRDNDDNSALSDHKEMLDEILDDLRMLKQTIKELEEYGCAE